MYLVGFEMMLMNQKFQYGFVIISRCFKQIIDILPVKSSLFLVNLYVPETKL